VKLCCRDLTAEVDGTPILNGVNLEVKGEKFMRLWGQMALVRVRSRKVLAGHPAYKVTGGDLPGAESVGNGTGRTSQGWCVSAFQYPLEIPGVSNLDFLRVAYNSRRKQHGLEN